MPSRKTPQDDTRAAITPWDGFCIVSPEGLFILDTFSTSCSEYAWLKAVAMFRDWITKKDLEELGYRCVPVTVSVRGKR